MEAEGARALLPATMVFPNSSNDKIKDVNVPVWQNTPCKCLLCDSEFDIPVQNLSFVAHLFSEHRLFIDKVHFIANLKGYIEYWRMRFSQQPITDFCLLMVIDEEEYYWLTDNHPEDNELSKGLLRKRLEWVLQHQKIEREDRSFVKACFFCRHVEKGSRSDFLSHLSYHHNFQLGHPDNMVFIDILLQIVEEKLKRLQCIYCEHIFKDRITLKEHMRKKFHKRINRKNKMYDKFFIINYIQVPGEHNVEDEYPEDSWSQWREEGSDWSEWQEEPTPIFCLFCEHSCGEWEDILEHMYAAHNFSYKLLMSCYNFYEQVKIVNYIRREVYLLKCPSCKTKFPCREELLLHMTNSQHFTLPAKCDWDHPEFFFSTYENDAFLCLLEDNEEDPLDQLTTQMSSQCSVQPKHRDGESFFLN